jgi:dienelactone hydrolase
MAHALQDITVTTGIDAATPGLKGVLGIPGTPGPWPAVVVVHEASGFGPDPEAAADAWKRIDAFFDEHLVAPAK